MNFGSIVEFALWAVVLGAVGWSLWQLKRRTGALPLNFVLAVVVLAVAAMGLNGATQFMQLHFKKQPVAIAVPLKEISSKLGPWVQVSKDEPLEGDIEAALGTKEYVFRDYVNADIVGPEFMKKFDEQIKDKKTGQMRPLTANERHGLVYQIIRPLPYGLGRPDAVVNLAVTYYTGLVDTVAHIPDRCYIADGYEPSEYTTETWQTTPHPSEVRLINFEDQSGNGKLPRCVAYFFRVDDEYASDPLGVRLRLQKLQEKYGFYSKVELMMTTNDRAKAKTTMTSFLSSALPEIEKCYPDWKKVTSEGSQQKPQIAEAPAPTTTPAAK